MLAAPPGDRRVVGGLQTRTNCRQSADVASSPLVVIAAIHARAKAEADSLLPGAADAFRRMLVTVRIVVAPLPCTAERGDQ